MLIVENIGGLGQRDNRWHGAKDMHENVLAVLKEYSPQSVRVRYRCWDDNWRSIATDAKLLKNRYWREPFLIVVNAYSYGAGWGLVQFAKHLRKMNLFIECTVISDAIYHPPTRLLAPLSVMGFPVKLPSNVLSYHGFYQDVERPMGVKLTGSNCLSWENLKVAHTLMDDEPAWHNLCNEVALKHARIAVPSKDAVPVGAPDSVTLIARTNGNSHGK